MIIKKQDIDSFIADNAELKYKNFHSKLINTKYAVNGIRIPKLRSFAKKLAGVENFDEFVNFDKDTYEIVMLTGIAICYRKMSIENKLVYLDNFIKYIDDWSINDIVSCSLKDSSRTYYDYLLKGLSSCDEFVCRYSITSIMSNYIFDEYVDDEITKIINVKNDKYYVNMAIAWYVQVLAVKYPDKALKLLSSDNLSIEVSKMAKSKIRDSFRLSDSYKEQVENAIKSRVMKN